MHIAHTYLVRFPNCHECHFQKQVGWGTYLTIYPSHISDGNDEKGELVLTITIKTITHFYDIDDNQY